LQAAIVGETRRTNPRGLQSGRSDDSSRAGITRC
jgi:hypothetical protein